MSTGSHTRRCRGCGGGNKCVDEPLIGWGGGGKRCGEWRGSSLCQDALVMEFDKGGTKNSISSRDACMLPAPTH
ncbi:hypothetical protein E2C01_055783 [Portunus trituberculatus]|uniref:Uncharacterized protein n=1 Tax=Portunus trituberculatus TaxID=210409 RepID=A0A5B7GVZ4_PORTR|nr:hypothetical protein [Portunus trituberculatus]